MAKDISADEQITRIIQSQQNWKGAVLSSLRDTILSTSKEITEDVKWKMPSKPLGSPTWEVQGIICVADFLKNSVRLTFPKGASIDDQQGLFNSRLDSKTVRAIDFFEGEAIPRTALKRIIAQGVTLNKS
jgi:hypothetical protein